MAQFYTLLTQTGQAKMANAIALGTMIEITHLAVGDGNGALPVPDSNRETLVNEVRRAQINRLEVDPDNPSWLIAEQVLPPDVGGWTIREVGVIDADGDLIGYGNYPETYKPTLDQGSGRTQTIRMVLEVSHTAAVTLKVDPSVVLATREYVDDEIDKHEQSRNHPAATTTALGFVEKATTAEALGGATDKFPDSAGVHAAFNQFGIGTDSTVYPETAVIGDLPIGSFVSINTTEGFNIGLPTTRRAPGDPVHFNIITFGNSTRRTQIAVQVFNGTSSGATYTRQRHDGIWSNWDLFYHSGNFSPDSKADANALTGHLESNNAHAWGAITGKPETATRWPAWSEVSDKQLATPLTPGIARLSNTDEARAMNNDAVALTPAMLDQALRGANQNLSATGYQKLPGGMILQFGRTPKSSAAGDVREPFPIQFPTACLVVVLVADHTTGATEVTSVRSAMNAAIDGFDYGAWSDATTRVSGHASNYIAIGR